MKVTINKMNLFHLFLSIFLLHNCFSFVHDEIGDHMKKTIIIILLAMLGFHFLSMKGSALIIPNEAIRLRVLANSNSKEDQELKLKVRDSVINYMNKIIPENTTKENIIFIVNEHLQDFKEIAEKTIKENGFDYVVNINIGNFYFPTKTYGDISFPSGNYDGLRIEVGSSSGQNWWCVLFPPLCFVSPTNGIVPDDSKNELKENINSEEYQIISSGNKEDYEDLDIKFKFKLIELFN